MKISMLAAAALALSLPAAAARLGSAARAFPETRDTIRIFADQLPSQLTEPQRRFVATHYAGSQKQTRSWIRSVRQLNPNFLGLHYQLAVGTGPAPFLVGDRWTNDFPRVSKHEAWFLHDSAGHRLLQPAWDWSVMDLRLENGMPRTGFPDYWLNSAVQRMRENEDDGCFADSYTQDILMNQVRPPFDEFRSVDLCKRLWLPQLNRFGAFCASGFHRQPERFYYLPNLGGLVTTWDTVTDLGVGDGGMVEGFAASGPGNYYSEDDWKLQMSRILGLASRGKILLCQSYIRSDDSEGRWFVLGSYLLTRGSRSYVNMFQKNSLEWYPEYSIRLGPPIGGLPGDVSAFWKPEWGVYRREYANGIVLVNPSSAAVQVPDLGTSYRQVYAVGGGPVGADGAVPGSLTFAPATSVTIPAHSARVLLHVPSQRPAGTTLAMPTSMSCPPVV